MPKRATQTSFQKGQSGNPKGRKRKSVEQSELERWQRVIDGPSRNKILDKIKEEAEAGKPWAVQIVVDRFWPADFMAAKINEADGAKQDGGMVEAFRELINARRTPDAAGEAAPNPEPAA